MKKNLILAAILALSLISCSKHNDPSINPLPPNGPPPSEDYYFRGKVDSVFFSDSTAYMRTLESPTGASKTYITGWFIPANGGITLALTDITKGERLLNQANPNDTIKIFRRPIFSFYAGLVRDSYQGSGKINILEITSSYIRGTFECIAPLDSLVAGPIVPPLHFTEGEFKVKKP